MTFSAHITQVLLAFLILASSLVSAEDWQELNSEIDIRCTQTDSLSLACDYRLLFPDDTADIEAKHNNRSLAVSREVSSENDDTAIFFLIDTSDPARANVVDSNVKQIERFLLASKGHHKLGLASFDKKLHIRAPIGSSKSEFMTAARGLEAKGRTTELYRNLLLTIEKLSRSNARRKAIYLFSDGQAEDKAYFHADVVRAARKKGVVINSIGFPRSVSLSVALQTLRRLSEETGGIFIEADSNHVIDGKFYRDPYKNIDAGEKFSIDLSPISNTPGRMSTNISLSIATGIGMLNMRVPVKVDRVTPPSTSIVAAAKPTINAAATTPLTH